MSKNSNLTMDDLLGSTTVERLTVGSVVEGIITSVKKHELWVDLGANGTGVVLSREIGHGQPLEVGQSVTVTFDEPPPCPLLSCERKRRQSA